MIFQSAHIILVNKQGNILLTQRQDVPIWVIPGGHLEKGETPKDAAIRELYEETGIKANDVTLIAKYCIRNTTKKFLFSCQMSDNSTIKKSFEVRNARWVNPFKLPAPISLYETKKINDFLSYNNKVIVRAEFLDKTKELINQLKAPHILLWILFNLTKNRLTTKTFKI